MLMLRVRCSRCDYETRVAIGKFTTLCPVCGYNGLYKVKTESVSPRIRRTNGL
jgi:DNA-directed RNA polymerase subunit RPC12/RpoP